MANPCLDILKNGVYETHITTRTNNQDLDYKHYFESEQFKSDFQNGKHNLGVEAVIYGVPVKLDYGSDETQIKEFQQKVKDSTDFKMSNNFFLQSAEIIPNKDIIDAYKECIKPPEGFGFHISYETTETTIIFRVLYNNLDVAQKPVFKDVVITPSSKIMYQSKKNGDEILNNSESKFIFELAKDIKEVVFILNTDLTAVSEKAEIQKKGLGSGSLPIGTIITSFLTWDEFQKETENDKYSGGIWNGEFSFWSPCDGRKVSANSGYSKATGETNVPELRGLFLRGRNIFDSNAEDNGKVDKIPAGHEDSEGSRVRGSFQIDEIRSHAHTLTASLRNAPIRDSGGAAGDYMTTGSTDPFGGAETRPKNAAVYYYIRIN
jgi:hypothetical protein